jgi:NAD(P)-dependent dehydrogenase (short-subunit alcohol dehydrogenase family)
VVIANAPASAWAWTAPTARDLDVMRDTFATNNTWSAWRPPSTPSSTHAPAAQRRLVGIASVAAIRGLPGHGAYCASKAAVVAYCESLRGECGPSACVWSRCCRATSPRR